MEKAKASLRAPCRTPAGTGATKIFPPWAGIGIFFFIQKPAIFPKSAFFQQRSACGSNRQSNARPKYVGSGPGWRAWYMAKGVSFPTVLKIPSFSPNARKIPGAASEFPSSSMPRKGFVSAASRKSSPRNKFACPLRNVRFVPVWETAFSGRYFSRNEPNSPAEISVSAAGLSPACAVQTFR